MKKIGVFLCLIVFSTSFAWENWEIKRGYSKPYRDYWGNSYKNYNNMWKDSDGDGVMNYYDYNDRNPNITTPYDKPWGSRKLLRW